MSAGMQQWMNNPWPSNRPCVHNNDGRCPNYCGPNDGCKLEAVREMKAGLVKYAKDRFHVREPMTASDLGIVDQLLDDKVGMEP